jgi:hypothetical protein
VRAPGRCNQSSYLKVASPPSCQGSKSLCNACPAHTRRLPPALRRARTHPAPYARRPRAPRAGTEQSRAPGAAGGRSAYRGSAPWSVRGKRKGGCNRAGGAGARFKLRRALSGRWRGRGAGDERARRVRGRRGRAERCVLVGQFRAPRYVAARQPRRDGRRPPQSPRPRPPPARRHWPRRQGRAPHRPAPPRPVLSAAAPLAVRVLLWPRPQLLPAVRGDPGRALCCATGRTAEQPEARLRGAQDPFAHCRPRPPGRCARSVVPAPFFVCLFPGEPQRAGLPVANRTPGEGYGDTGVAGTLASLCPRSPLRPGKGRGSRATEMSRSSPGQRRNGNTNSAPDTIRAKTTPTKLLRNTVGKPS